jgi:DNA-binding MurR/RpiR family transcriptional regulator
MACANTDMLKEKQLVIGLQGHGATRQLEEALNKIRRNNAMPV